MKLKHAHVRHFKSIDDSTRVDIDPRVTALVGQNESGKTAFLQALRKARPVKEDGAEYEVEADYPRKAMLDYLDRHEWSPAVAASLTWELEAGEVSDINDKLGFALLDSLTFTTSHHYGNSYTIGLNVPEKAFVRHYAKAMKVPAEIKKKTGEANTVAELMVALESQDLNESGQEALEALRERFPAQKSWHSRLGSHLWTEHLSPRLPQFLYFDDYQILPGKVNLPDLQRRQKEDKLEDRHQAVLRLLKVAKVNLQNLLSPGGYEKEKARLEATSSKITRQVFTYWRQNTGLAVEFDVRDDPNDEPPFNDGKNLYIRVKNQRHDASLPFDQRSKGFIWFFSFLVWFESISRDEDANSLVLLLDEPGLSLHALAQADFLAFIEKLSADHQILYSTHSPFMVQSGRLERVRAVEDREGEGTVVSGDVSGSRPDTLFPLQAALGYSIAQNLFIAPNNLLVEGIADLTLLGWMADLLERRGEPTLRDDVVITPVGGLGKVPAFVSLFGANDLNLVVLHDYEGQPDQQLGSLIRNKLLPQRRVLHYGLFRDQIDSKPAAPAPKPAGKAGKKGAAKAKPEKAGPSSGDGGNAAPPADLEDLLEPADYMRYFSHVYAKRLGGEWTPDDLPGGTRIIDRINRHLRAKGVTLRESGGFNHQLVAQALASDDAFEPGEATLMRFARLFETVNALLNDARARM